MGPGFRPSAPARALKWDYEVHPVETRGSGEGGAVFGTAPAFDTYPANVTQPPVRVYWNCPAPLPDKPVEVIIDYRRSVPVTKFVHYFDRTGKRSSWKAAAVSVSDDGKQWAERQAFTALAPDYPQVLALHQPQAARFYRIEVREMTDKVEKLHTDEIETWYGTTIGRIDAPAAVQSEPLEVMVRVLSPDAPLEGGSLRWSGAAGRIDAAPQTPLPDIPAGGSAEVAVKITPRQAGEIPLVLELQAGGFSIDRQPWTLRVRPKLVLKTTTPPGAATLTAGGEITVSGTVTNGGSTPAEGVRVSWMDASVNAGNLPPGGSAEFSLKTLAVPGYHEGLLTAAAGGGERSVLRRGVICPGTDRFVLQSREAETQWISNGIELKMESALTGGRGAFGGWLMLFSGAGATIPMKSTGTPEAPQLAADIGGAVLRLRPGLHSETGDPHFDYEVIPHDPESLTPASTKFTVRVAVNDPRTLFRPHFDVFRKEDGPKHGYGDHTHYSPTRMLSVQTNAGTVSMVPDTDNMEWGFAGDFSMNATLNVDLSGADPAETKVWQPLLKGPRKFRFTLPMRGGDWWDAYRHVVKDLFKFEQARQWAMPLTQMQMLSVRQMERQENWSPIFNTMRSYPGVDFHFNFYGSTYTIPAFYSYYLATDDKTAKAKAESVVTWLVQNQTNGGPLDGGWYSQYLVKGVPPSFALEGTDQAGNRWMLPHSTGSSVKTLLWYWEASGKQDARVLAAARKGCDFLLIRQHENGSWPYAYDLNGKSVSDLPDAGQIWCVWALWKMHQFTGGEKYRAAALKAKDFFVKTFADNHVYQGYWEDVSGGSNPAARSWETYEAAIACQVFADMGERELALRVARDSAVSLWTRVTTTRKYETAYGQTIEQGAGGPSQAQSPMAGAAMQRMYEISGDRFWNDLSGAVKAIHFCADPDQAYGMCAIAGWDECFSGTISPPVDNVNIMSPPGGVGRPVWNEWQTAQYAWLALDWLVREGNMRAPQHLHLDPLTMRGTVLGQSGRVKMPEERCDVTPMDHIDVNWAGYQNDTQYVLMLMNHQEACAVAVRPHEAHLDVWTRLPRILISGEKEGDWREIPVEKRGVQYSVNLPAKGTALLVWERIR
ncbi:MAG TPA: hypothetical protein VG796_31325 [Verrucomicrobiales bacterium]|nr:hypothetical protein [Verrucomicrobiales bacterium]